MSTQTTQTQAPQTANANSFSTGNNKEAVPNAATAPSAFIQFLIATLTGAIESVGESKLEQVLQQLHDSDVESYKAAIFGGHALVTKLGALVAKSTNKIDDAVLGAIDQAINASAKTNNVTL